MQLKFHFCLKFKWINVRFAGARVMLNRSKVIDTLVLISQMMALNPLLVQNWMHLNSSSGSTAALNHIFSMSFELKALFYNFVFYPHFLRILFDYVQPCIQSIGIELEVNFTNCRKIKMSKKLWWFSHENINHICCLWLKRLFKYTIMVNLSIQ